MTNPYLHPTDFVHEICMLTDADFDWLYHIRLRIQTGSALLGDLRSPSALEMVILLNYRNFHTFKIQENPVYTLRFCLAGRYVF